MSTTTKTPRKKTPARRTTAARGKTYFISEDNVASHWVHIGIWLVILYVLYLFIDAVTPILLPFVIGALMAYLFDPVADRLERRGVGRGTASVLITAAFFSLLLALLAWMGPMLYHQLGELINKIPTLIRQVEIMLRQEGEPLFRSIRTLTNGRVNGVPNDAGDVIEQALAVAGGVVMTVLASGGAVLNVVSLLLITPIVAFYLLRDWDKLVAKVDVLLPRAYADNIRQQAKEVNRALAGYLRGQTYVILILAAFYVVALTLLGVKYSLLLGVLAGFFVIVPYIGTLISTLLGMMVAYGQYDLDPLFWGVAGVYALGQVLESQILVPKIIGENVGLHPLWLLFGMLAGGVLLGFVGVLLAVPITAVISVLVKFAIGLYLDSSLYTEK